MSVENVRLTMISVEQQVLNADPAAVAARYASIRSGVDLEGIAGLLATARQMNVGLDGMYTTSNNVQSLSSDAHKRLRWVGEDTTNDHLRAALTETGAFADKAQELASSLPGSLTKKAEEYVVALVTAKKAGEALIGLLTQGDEIVAEAQTARAATLSELRLYYEGR